MFWSMVNYIRRLAAKYRYFFGAIVLVIILFIAGCSPSTYKNTSDSSKSVSSSISSANKLSTENKTESSSEKNETSDSFSIRLTGSNFPDWFMNDLRVASDIKFPTQEDGYAWNQNMSNIQNNYANRIESFKYLEDGQLWIAGYAGTKTVSGYSTYAGPLDMKKVYQTVVNASKDKNDDWGSLTPVLLFESDKTNFVPAMSWDWGNRTRYLTSTRNRITLPTSGRHLFRLSWRDRRGRGENMVIGITMKLRLGAMQHEYSNLWYCKML